MKIVVFEAETREAPSFEALIRTHEVSIVEAAFDAENAGDFADVEVVSTFIKNPARVQSGRQRDIAH